MDLTTSRRRPILHEVQTPQDLDFCGNAGGIPQSGKLGEGRRHNTGGFQGGGLTALCAWQTVGIIPEVGDIDFR